VNSRFAAQELLGHVGQAKVGFGKHLADQFKPGFAKGPHIRAKASLCGNTVYFCGLKEFVGKGPNTL
jgi:hypothetical protein